MVYLPYRGRIFQCLFLQVDKNYTQKGEARLAAQKSPQRMEISIAQHTVWSVSNLCRGDIVELVTRSGGP